MIGKKINQLATELAPVSTDLTIIGDPISGVSKKITLAQLGAIFSGAVSFYTNLAGFPATGDINVIYCAKDTQKLYLWSGSAYVEVFPSQALLDTYQLRSEKGVSNGYASLDSTGKVPISQLPSSIMEYKGTWNAATNTPTLANGTGDTGDVYICNVAGTVNFGAGPITFAVGDYVIYSGSIWQRSSGAVGTVTSVAASITGNSIGITGSPVTTSGTLAFAFAGTGAQYIKGDGTLATFPNTISQAEKLITEVYNNTGATLTKGTIVYINGGQGNLPTVTKALATGDSTSAQTFGVVQADITNNNNGYVVVAGKLSDLDTQAYTPGTQLYLSSTTAGTWTSTKQYAPAHLVYVGIVVRSHPTQGIVEIKIQNGYELDEIHDVAAQNPSNNDILQYKTSTGLWTKVAGTTSNIAEGSNLYYTDARSRAALSFTAGSGAYNSTTGVITIPTNTNQLTNGANYITLGSLSASSPLSYNNTTGAFSISQANSTTNGFLSSADWTTFNNKQNALSGTGFVKISGTTISYDNSTYLTTSAAASTYLPLVLNGSANTVDINGQQFTIQGSAGGFTSGRIIVDPVFSAIGYQNAGVFDGLKILTNGNAEFTNSGVTRFFNQVRFDSTLTNGTYTYTLPGASGTIALVGGAGVGTVTSVGLSSATSGVTIGSTPVTTSGTITLAIATASGSQQGLLSSTDWTTFNNKQNALTNPVTGTGTTNYLSKFTGTSTIGNSQIFDNGTNVGINQASPTRTLDILGATGIGTVLKLQGAAGTTTYLQLAYNGATNAQSGYIGYNSSSQMQFFTNDTLRATLDASGNLGLGVTPSAWNSGLKVQQIGYSSFVLGSGSEQAIIGSNWFQNTSASNVYLNNGFATFYQQVSGQHQFFTAPSGTAGNAISFTQAMTLDASGRLGIGVTSPTARLDVVSTSTSTAGLVVRGGSSIGTASSGSGQIFVGQTTTYRLSLAYDDNTGYAYIDNLYDNANSNIYFRVRTNGTPINALTLFGSGAATFSNALQVAGQQAAANYGGTGLNFDFTSGNIGRIASVKTTSGGSQLQFLVYNTSGTDVNALQIASTGAATFSSSVRSGTHFQLSGRTTSYGYQFPDWQIYNTTGGGLAFNNYSSDFLTIASSGNVGIGTTNPSATLQVVGGIRRGDNSVYWDANSDANGNYIEFNGTTNATRRIRIQGINDAGNRYSAINIFGGSEYITFQTYDVERMRINSNGNVGIGTTNSSYPLNVYKAGSNVFSTVYNVAAFNDGSAAYKGINLGYISNEQTGVIYSETNSAASNIAFWTYSGSAWGERMRITSGGNVGIGTTSPAERLTVAGGNFRLNGVNANSRLIIYQDYSSSAVGVQLFNNSGVSVIDLNGNAGNINITGSISTGAPSGGSAGSWKLGTFTSGSATIGGKVRVEINGVAYDLLTT